MNDISVEEKITKVPKVNTLLFYGNVALRSLLHSHLPPLLLSKQSKFDRVQSSLLLGWEKNALVTRSPSVEIGHPHKKFPYVPRFL